LIIFIEIKYIREIFLSKLHTIKKAASVQIKLWKSDAWVHQMYKSQPFLWELGKQIKKCGWELTMQTLLKQSEKLLKQPQSNAIAGARNAKNNAKAADIKLSATELPIPFFCKLQLRRYSHKSNR
jgi:hypothetical protein